MKNDKRNLELRERFLDFSVSVLKFLTTLPYRKEYDVLRYQLSKSSTSIGANYEESQNTTYREFIQRVKIALREANETKYWLSIIKKLDIIKEKQVDKLYDEANQITLILGSIASKAQKRVKNE